MDVVAFIKTYHDEIIAVTAVVAILMSALTMVFTICALRIQRTHNYKSLTPIAWTPFGDYEDHLTVRLENNGVGPLIVRSFVVTDGKESKKSLIDWMPRTGIWDHFIADIDGRCLAPGMEITLLQLKGDPSSAAFRRHRDECRLVLSSLRIELQYADVYERGMPTYKRDLKWFARNLGLATPETGRKKQMRQKASRA